MNFANLDALRAHCLDLPAGNALTEEAAIARQSVLTKPPGSLGRLEELAIWLARWQGRDRPQLTHVDILVFAGSHGVTAHNISAFPPQVTTQMVANFNTGGAAINQLAQAAQASLKVYPLQVETLTNDFTKGTALNEADFLAMVTQGYQAVEDTADLICLGEMGIGNTTVAAAICLGLYGGSGADWVGRGTGIDDAGLTRKAQIIEQAVACNKSALGDPLRLLAALGGREFAAMFGAALACRHHGIPLIIDGFISTAAVAPFAALNNQALAHAQCAHVSAEKAHSQLLNRLGKRALLDLDMRLGEGSGGGVAIHILRAALACHNGMATFAEAGVSTES